MVEMVSDEAELHLSLSQVVHSFPSSFGFSQKSFSDNSVKPRIILTLSSETQ